jgi:hypothetical protein
MTRPKRYSFFVLVGAPASDEARVLRLSVSSDLQRELGELFSEQAAATGYLSDQVENVLFDGRFKPDDDQLLVLRDFELPDEITTAAISPAQFKRLRLEARCNLNIKAVFAAHHESQTKQVTVFFQTFNRAQILGHRFSIFAASDTFQKFKKPGLTLQDSVVAVYHNRTLYFRSYPTVSRFLDLMPFFQEATNADIQAFVNESPILVENLDLLLSEADSWMRRRFRLLHSNKLLNEATLPRLVEFADRLGISVTTREHESKRQLIFPSNKKEAKQLLRLLCEEIYEGELTKAHFVTNSHRPFRQS